MSHHKIDRMVIPTQPINWHARVSSQYTLPTFHAKFQLDLMTYILVYTIMQPAGRRCGGAAAANFRTADYYAAGRTPTKMQPAPVCSLVRKSRNLGSLTPAIFFGGGRAPKILKAFWILLFRDYCQEKFGPRP